MNFVLLYHLIDVEEMIDLEKMTFSTPNEITISGKDHQQIIKHLEGDI